MAYTPINKPTDYFNTKLWSGNSSTQAITGIGFAPDMVWGKQRTGTESHQLLDIIRGANNILVPNTVATAAADSQILNSFDSDGYTLGSQNQLNDTGYNYVGWNWKGGGAGSSNTDGSITSTVSANTTSGFSIVKFVGNGLAGATIGHGLGAVPKMTIIKSMTAGEDWIIPPLNDPTNYIVLNSTGAEGNGIGPFNNTAATSSVFSVGTWGTTNGNSQTLMAYCFAEVTGYSKIGSYVGNGNANGTFVYTGFKPAFVLIKNTDFASNWNIFTGKIPGYNQINDILQPNLSSAENGTFAFDMLSNGFKHRSGDVMDRNGDTHIYMAFAEEPLVGSNNVPATAR
jgi:hypothetical protein